jgi:hypothetical protein
MDNAGDDLKPAVMTLFKKLVIINEIAPTAKHCTYNSAVLSCTNSYVLSINSKIPHIFSLHEPFF